MTGRCLVLGAGGRVGRMLRGVWKTATNDTPVLFQSRTQAPGIDLVAPFDCRIADLVEEPIGAVLILSGVTRGSGEDLKQNTSLAQTGIDIASAVGASIVAVCSSAAVYRPDSGGRCIPETTGDVSLQPYGFAKWQMEQAVLTQARGSATPQVICLRLANVAGADMLGDNARLATVEHPLLLDRFEDGQSPRRSYLAPSTLARVLCALSAHVVPEDVAAINLADPGPPVAMSDMLTALAEQGCPVPWAERSAPEGAVPIVSLDVARMLECLPHRVFDPHLTTAAGLARDWIAGRGGRL